MVDKDRTAVFEATEKLVNAFHRYERTPNDAHLHDLRVAVTGLKLIHRQLLEDLVDGIPHQPDPPQPRHWWEEA